MRGMRFVVAGALAAGLVVVASAQRQPGGFGGGFGGGPTFLVSNKAVQEELKMTEEQVTKLKDWGKEFQKTAQEIREKEGVKFGGFGKGGGKIDEEMLAKMATATAKVTEAAYKQLGEVLKKEQVDRLKQIERQQLGIRAFTNAEVVSVLKLSDSQKASVKGITEDYTKESREIRTEAAKNAPKGKGGFGGFGRTDPETQKKLDKLAGEYIAKIVDVLDDSQKKTWKDMIGEKFDTSKLIPNFNPPKKD